VNAISNGGAGPSLCCMPTPALAEWELCLAALDCSSQKGGARSALRAANARMHAGGQLLLTHAQPAQPDRGGELQPDGACGSAGGGERVVAKHACLARMPACSSRTKQEREEGPSVRPGHVHPLLLSLLVGCGICACLQCVCHMHYVYAQ